MRPSSVLTDTEKNHNGHEDEMEM